MSRLNSRRDSGFALMVVVFLLFAIGMSAAATYQLIRTEVDLSTSGSDADRARAAAEAGARIVIGNAVRGVPNDTVFTIDDGSAFPPEVQVTVRRQVDEVDWEDLYLVTAIGRVTNPQNFDYPAIREVRVFGRLRNPPMLMTNSGPMAVLIATEDINESVTVDGNDQGTCSPMPPGADDLNDDWRENRTLAQIGLPDFSYFTSSDFPVDYDWNGGAWPFAGVPVGQLGYPTTTDYPVTRVTGNFNADNTRNGYGVLIVPGNLFASSTWTWNGIVLIGGHYDTPNSGTHNIVFRGVMVAGLTDPPGNEMAVDRGNYRYDSCHFYYASQAIGAMNPEPLTWWSGY